MLYFLKNNLYSIIQTGDIMKKYFIYLLIYSFLGYILERIINYFAYGEITDGGLLYGPYQPLYGAGILMAIIINDLLIEKLNTKKLYKNIILLFIAILTTALSEGVTGFGYDYLTGISLWNYGSTFTCTYKYVCLIPTSLFGIGSFLVIKFFHPYIKNVYLLISKPIFYLLIILFALDIILSF